jgi:hypothetical protein
MALKLRYAYPVKAVGEGDGGDEGNVDTKPNVTSDGSGDITFTAEQEAVIKKREEAAAARVRKAGQQALTEIDNLRAVVNLSKEDKDKLNDRVAQLTGQLRTAEEQAAERTKAMETQRQQEVTQLTSERDRWRNDFTRLSIGTAITQACMVPDHEAINPAVVSSILSTRTALVEDLDKDGRPKGTLSPRVQYDHIGEDGNEVTLDLTVAEAVKKMAADSRYMHLFKGKGSGGLGGGSSASGGGRDMKAILADPVKYQKWRTEHPEEHRQWLDAQGKGEE